MKQNHFQLTMPDNAFFISVEYKTDTQSKLTDVSKQKRNNLTKQKSCLSLLQTKPFLNVRKNFKF